MPKTNKNKKKLNAYAGITFLHYKVEDFLQNIWYKWPQAAPDI